MPEGIGSSTVPGAYRYVPVQSSIVPTLLQSSFLPVAATRFRAPRYLLGFLPSFRHHPVAPVCRASTAPLAPSSVFSTARRLLQRGLRACFIPQPDSGPSLVQGFVHFVQPSALIRLDAPMPLSIRTLTCKQAATHEHLDSDVLFHTKPLFTGLVISLPHDRAPLRVRLLLQVTQAPATTAYPSPITHAVALSSRVRPPRRAPCRLERSATAHFQRLRRAPVARTSDLPELFGPSILLFTEPEPSLQALHHSASSPKAFFSWWANSLLGTRA
jgi:hypothetical protein